MRFTNSSGLATWCRDNMAVRHDQAVHIRAGLDADELPVNEVVNVGGGERVFRCDLPLMDEAHAIDALETLSAATVLGQSRVLATDGGAPERSWVDRHVCYHDEDPAQPCQRPEPRRFGPEA